ncbi:hypothetical protein ACN47E_003153 [Coniothyrium glycines]
MARKKPTEKKAKDIAATDKTGAQVKKPKPKPKPKHPAVRRLENGLLNVDRKAGKHMKAIKANANSPLLRLPPEIRNMIWKYAVGGECIVLAPLDRLQLSAAGSTSQEFLRYMGWREQTSALFRVCRQIYSETALLPFECGTFTFKSPRACDWIRELLPRQQSMINEIHIVTDLLQWVVLDKRGLNLILGNKAGAFPLDLLSGLRQLVVQVTMSMTSESCLLSREAEFADYVKKHKHDVEVIFEHIPFDLKPPQF